MTDRPKITRRPGEPKQATKNRGDAGKSKVTEVQDPLIAGDAGKAGKRVETGEANVDEAGQIRPNKGEVDLLH